MLDTLLTHTLLSHEEEIALARRLQAGDKEALDELCRHNYRLVYKITRRYYSTDFAMTFDDLMQHGVLGLIHAAHKYDPDRGVRFSTYATVWIRQHVQRAALTSGPIPRSANPNYKHQKAGSARIQALRQAPIARLDAPLTNHKGIESNDTLADILADDSISVEDQVFSAIEFERIFKALRLNERGQAIMRDYLAGYSRIEAQERHGVSHSWMSAIIGKKTNKERIMHTQVRPTCIEIGCDQPAWVNSKGITTARCQEHQRDYWNAAKKARRDSDKLIAPPTAKVSAELMDFLLYLSDAASDKDGYIGKIPTRVIPHHRRQVAIKAGLVEATGTTNTRRYRLTTAGRQAITTGEYNPAILGFIDEPDQQETVPHQSHPAQVDLATDETVNLPHHIGQPTQEQQIDGCTCPDCIYREIVSLLSARNPRIEELVQVMLSARRLRDDLGI